MSTLPSTLKLGSLLLQSPFLLSPLESVSDAAFRRTCFQQGAGLTFTEMIRARGIVRNNKSTLDLIDSFTPEVPTGLQLMVTSSDELTEALAKVEQLAQSTHPHFQNLCSVDLNFGCPSPDIIQIGAGPALLKRRNKLREIFEALAAWKAKTPLKVGAVSAKIRLGLHSVEQQQKVYLTVAELANDSLDYLVVHARHARQQSADAPTWSAIAEVKAKARIPIIGNGNVFTRADAERLMAETGCDGAMVARAAIRSPWVFRELRGLGPGEPTAAELSQAEADHWALADRLQTRDKFREWHLESFRRLWARQRGEAAGNALPSNSHMA